MHELVSQPLPLPMLSWKAQMFQGKEKDQILNLLLPKQLSTPPERMLEIKLLMGNLVVYSKQGSRTKIL